MRTDLADVLVIGSGFGAAAPALRLARAGFRVTVVEKGPRVDTATDLRQTHDPQYLLRYLKSTEGRNVGFTHAEALGGGSAFYELISLRAPTPAFEQTGDDGCRLWPEGLDRRALDPHYERAEAMLQVAQVAPDEVPRSGLVFSRLMKNLGYSCERARHAVRGCHGCGYCVSGCVYDAKQSLLLNYLPEAVAAGAVIETDLEAVGIEPLSASYFGGTAGHGPPAAGLPPFRFEVTCQSRRSDAGMRRFRARVVILAAGTVGTAALLLKSRQHLRRLSPHVGRNICFNGGVKVMGLLPEGCPDGDMYAGRSHPAMVSYEFMDSHGLMVTAGKALPLHMLAGARLRPPGQSGPYTHFGSAHVEFMKKLRRRAIILVAFGLTPPAARLEMGDDNRIRTHLHLNSALRSYHAATRGLLESILVRNGCQLVDVQFVNRQGRPRRELYFSTAHQMGSCRMADSPEQGVVGVDGQVFHYPGLFITDGAAIPASLAVNPSLTILANAERIAQGILDSLSIYAGQRADAPAGS